MSKHGKRKEGGIRGKKNGRPAFAADLLVGLRLPIETRQAVLAWAKGQPGQPNLSAAIRRLIDIGLSGTAGTKQIEMPAVELCKPVQVVEGGQRDQREPDGSPQAEAGTQHRKTEVERTARAVGWTPRVAETAPRQAPKSLALISALPPAPPRARPAITRASDDKPYQMPEDVKAFNEYWTWAERKLGRHLDYEEVVVLFNQDRAASNFFVED